MNVLLGWSIRHLFSYIGICEEKLSTSIFLRNLAALFRIRLIMENLYYHTISRRILIVGNIISYLRFCYKL